MSDYGLFVRIQGPFVCRNLVWVFFPPVVHFPGPPRVARRSRIPHEVCVGYDMHGSMLSVKKWLAEKGKISHQFGVPPLPPDPIFLSCATLNNEP